MNSKIELRELGYREELERISRGMILVHRSETLIKLIARAVVRTLKVTHAGIFLYNKDKDAYILIVSRGREEVKIPPGLVKLSPSSPIIKYFREREYRLWPDNFLLLDRISGFLRQKKKKRKALKEFCENLRFEFNLYKIKACIPAFFREELIGVMILGEKFNRKSFTKEELGFLSILASDVAMAIQNAWLFEDLQAQVEHNKRLFLNTVMALSAAIEAKDRYTLGHTERVTRYALKIAEEVAFFKHMDQSEKEEFYEDVRIAASLHDIGKIGVSEAILNKQESLTPEERKEIEKHPLIGYEIVSPIQEFKEVVLGIKYHHERYEGGGYPEGLRGRKIPLIAAVISVADAFDAMSTDRPYRKAFSKEEVIKEILNQKGKQFHPLVIKSFLRAYKKGTL